MFERFTERARTVVREAQEAARDLKHGEIGTDHLLLGLAREGEGTSARVLASLDLDGARLVELVKGQRSGDVAVEVPGQLPFTDEAKKALEGALREALSLGHNYIGTEHILLALAGRGRNLVTKQVAMPDYRSTQVFDEAGVSGEQIRDQVIRVLSGGSAEGREHKRKVATADATKVLAEGDFLTDSDQNLADILQVALQLISIVGRALKQREQRDAA